MHSEPKWYERAFTADYVQVYSHRDDASAQREATWVLAQMGLPARSRILDLCCGNGRHSQVLDRSGMSVVGLDLSLPLLQEARLRKPARSAFLRGDMRRIPIRSATIDAVTSFFTSFGYFQNDSENIAVIGEMYRVLRPRGSLFFDFLNTPYVIANLIAESRDENNGAILIQKRRITTDGKRVEKEVVFHKDTTSEPVHYHESVRLFTRTEIESFLCAAGFRVGNTYGSLKGDPYTKQSPRLAIFATSLPNQKDAS